MAVLSPELSFLSILNGAYSQTGTVDLSGILSSYTGSEPIIVDRQRRAGGRIDHPALTGVAVGQPAPLRDLTAVKGAKDQGLIARFVAARVPSRAGSRALSLDDADLPDVADTAQVRAWADLLAALAGRTPADTPPVLRLARPALQGYVDWHNRLEPERGNEGGRWSLIADFAGKAHGLAPRVAALFYLADNPAADATAEIPRAVVEAAIAVTEWALAAHLSAVGAARIPEVVARAVRVVDAAARGTLTGTCTEPAPWAPFTLRDMSRYLGGGTGQVNVAEAGNVADELTHRGYIAKDGNGYRWRPGLADGADR